LEKDYESEILDAINEISDPERVEGTALCVLWAGY